MPRFTGRNQGKGSCTGNGQGRGRGRGLCRSSAVDQEVDAPLRRSECTQDGKGQSRTAPNQDRVPNNNQK